MREYELARILVFVVYPLLRAFLKSTYVARVLYQITGGAVSRLRYTWLKKRTVRMLWDAMP